MQIANADSKINKIVFEKNVQITLTKPAIYNGKQALILNGNNAIIDGSAAGSFLLDINLTAIPEKGSLVFNTAVDIKINNLTVKNSATRSIVIKGLCQIEWVIKFQFSTQKINHVDKIIRISIPPRSFLSHLNFIVNTF